MTMHQGDTTQVSGPGVTQALPQLLVPKISISAFCVTPDVSTAVDMAAADRRMSRASVAVKQGGIAAATAAYRDMPSPNLVVVESQADQATLLEELEALAQECVPGTKVIVIGFSNDITLYRALLDRGVTDYLVAPLDPMSLITAISRSFREADEQKLGRVTAFIGARGGAGSSTVSHNVAASIANRLEADVLLVDLDLPFGTVGLDFDIEPSHGTAEVLKGADRIDEILLDRLAMKRTERLRLLAATAAFDSAYDLKESELKRLLDVSQSSAQHIVLDLPQTWTSWARTALLSADEIVITATPDLGSMRNAKNMIEAIMQARPNDAPPKLVLNQVGMPKRTEIKPADFAAAVRIEPSACVQFDPQLFGKAANNGELIVESAGKTPAARAFEDLAKLVSGQKEVRATRRKNMPPLFGRLLGKR